MIEKSNLLAGSLIGITELAEKLGISKNTIYYLKSTDPNFPHVKIGKHLKFEFSKVLEYYKKKTQEQIKRKFKLGSAFSSLTTKNKDNGDAKNPKKEDQHGNY